MTTGSVLAELLELVGALGSNLSPLMHEKKLGSKKDGSGQVLSLVPALRPGATGGATFKIAVASDLL